MPHVFVAGNKIKASEFNENFDYVEDATNLLVPATDDTGSPWNLPYPDGGSAGSLAKTIEDLAEATATGLSAAGGLVQIVSATDTTQRETTSSTFVDAGISVTITPQDASNTLYFIWNFRGAAFSSSGSGSPTSVYQVTNSANTAVTAGGAAFRRGPYNIDFENSQTCIGSTAAGSTSAQTFKGRFRSTTARNRIYNNLTTGVLLAIEVKV
jgi:hypothetical protein